MRQNSASKTIYALHLIDGDNVKDVNGIDCELTCPITIEVSRLDEVEKEDIYSRYPEITFFMHVMIQYWASIKLTSNGETENN